MHYLVGNLGHLLVILSFVSSLVVAFSYYKAAGTDAISSPAWLRNARFAYGVHVVSVLGIVVALFWIIYRHYFEYHYAYSHSSLRLPAQYMISCFWEGQEGSFLLWMFWNAVIGLTLIITNRYWEAPVMTWFAAVQAFLASMILGVVIPGINLKIGSSPFLLLRDVIQDPIFTVNPEFVPRDGNGLNPLLQNYWMVIHPPTLFLGFASTLVPFAFCLSGLWKGRYREWVRPALPWTIFSAAVLGLGILMGGYWAYETLNFGGYWNWDPVENSSLVPWLVLVASLHTMITFRNSESALRLTVILAVTVFLLVLYSTFLTRSGILGEASVHSFTDLGLSGQLLIYLLFFIAAAAGVIAYRWKSIPATAKEVATYSREFWVFIGAAVLCLSGFQIIVETSKPVYNAISKAVGGLGNMAPRTDAVAFYSSIQLWFAVGIALLSAVGQFFWWRRVESAKLKKELLPPVLISLLLFAAVISLGRVTQPTYMLLALAGIFTAVANAKILINVMKSSPSLSGGSVAHIGIGMVLIGILFSSGYSKVVSLNNTGLLISRDFDESFNRENLLLFLHEPRTMAGYEIEYMGERLELRGRSGFVSPWDVEATVDPYKVVATKDISWDDKHVLSRGDTFEIYPENTYYEIRFRKDGKEFSLYPRAQVNPTMGLLASPDIHRTVLRDIYTHVSSVRNPDEEVEWGKSEEVNVKAGQQFFANDFVTVLEGVTRVEEVEGVTLSGDDVAVKAVIRARGKYGEYTAEPLFLIRDRMAGRIWDEIPELGLKLGLLNIHPETEEFTIGISARQKDWVILKALEKPMINLLWIGTLVMMGGFGIAVYRRFGEFRKMKDRGME
jgi:cytochrome c-type biogenesis protein CcmF